MTLDLREKCRQLYELAETRRITSFPGYASLHEFQDGRYDCNYVSPLAIAGHNLEAEVMVVMQDWTSSNWLEKEIFYANMILGWSPPFPTIPNLQKLLAKHLGLTLADCYLTNLFPFVKDGNASAKVAPSDMDRAAELFTLREIEIIEPRLIICPGKQTFHSLMRVCAKRTGKSAPVESTLRDAIENPFFYSTERGTAVKVYCVAHPGSKMHLHRSEELVSADWDAIGADLKAL